MSNYYLGGPMSGLPFFNIHAFREAADMLRAKGWNIISPAELDSQAVQDEALKSANGVMVDGKVAGETWGDMLARDVKIIADNCIGVVLLPGWQGSRGAKLEATVGVLCKHSFFEYQNGQAFPVSAEYIKHQLAVNL